MRGDFIFLLQMHRNQVAGSIPAGCIFSYLDEYPYAGNVRFSCFFKWMQRGPSHRFDDCRVYFSSLNPSLLNCGDLIFLLQMQRNQVAGSITAGCTFYSRGDYDHHGRTWRSAPLRRFCAIQQDSKCRETYKRDHLIIHGQAQRPAPTKGLTVNE